ncbi:hypothetical protein BKA66DRAFT_444773 [Pyrenochaeta sp. MPI-SDFR-AT-0127]|nr:hypothetical protein BKA66DRAFT_444773 [Pyrenochaeta sp. MPI-SDFR-AT-0127]
MAATTSQSPFLDILPPELRLHIYEHLLTTETPLKGIVARGDDKYDLHTAILRVNKQIYEEARSIFFGKNTFYISSLLPLATNDGEEGSGGFEPPLQLKQLSLVRHLEVDLLYYPKTIQTIRDSSHKGSWKPFCPAAERYVMSLSFLLGAMKSSLLSLKLCADSRRYAQLSAADCGPELQASSIGGAPISREAEPEEEVDALSVQKLLTGFHMADTSPRFLSALSNLSFRSVPLRFDFPESYFDFVVDKPLLVRRSLVVLAGQVLLARSDIMLKAVMAELGDDHVDEREAVCSVREGVVDLAGHVALTWPGREGELIGAVEVGV